MPDNLGSEFRVRVLRHSEGRAALDVFLSASHASSTSDQDWEVLSRSIDIENTYAAFIGTKVIGVCDTFVTDIAVPGGRRVAARAVGRFGVRADHTRRGVGRRLMTTMLTHESAPLVLLRASEGDIYRRYGFGVATRARDLSVDVRQSVINPEVPDTGTVRLLTSQEAAGLLEPLYAKARGWTGSIARPKFYNALSQHEIASHGLRVMVAIHHGSDGDDGYARYQVRRISNGDRPARCVLSVEELCCSSRSGWATLWRFLVGVPLVDQVRAGWRPLDEPVEFLFADPRICKVEALNDELWLRLTDVLAALRLRAYSGAGEIVVAIDDPVLAHNRGHYRVSADGVQRTNTAPQLSLGVDALACAYLGDVSFSMLAAAGRADVHAEHALGVADQLFATTGSPWCGTYL